MRDDPRWMTAQVDGTDHHGNAIRRGDRVFYYPRTRTLLTGARAEQAARDFAAAVDDERMAGG